MLYEVITKFLFLYNWVRFVGISGSVSAGFAKEDDDIDLVIVVRDGCAWIYRGILTLRNIKSHFMRTKRDGENVKDLFCINFVIEEKGLTLDSDIFNFHELMYLIPLHNDVITSYSIHYTKLYDVTIQSNGVLPAAFINQNLEITALYRGHKSR